MSKDAADTGIGKERERILAEYQRRATELPPQRYAPWQAAELFMRCGRERVAAHLLHALGVFPRRGDRCLEVGYGAMGWLATLIGWGLRSEDLAGVELDAGRAAKASAALPGADLRIGDATEMDWPDGEFRLIISSTVFTSILDRSVRERLAVEMQRVLAPGGAILWYDFRVNNPQNPHVRGVSSKEVRRLFAGLRCRIRSVTLAPPLARFIAPLSFSLAAVLECLPFLRTHLLGVLVKEGRKRGNDGDK